MGAKFRRIKPDPQWTPNKLNRMKLGGNERFRSYLTSKGVVFGDATMKERYTCDAAKDYYQHLKELVDEDVEGGLSTSLIADQEAKFAAAKADERFLSEFTYAESESDEEFDDEHSQVEDPHVSRVRRLYRRLATHWRNHKVAVIWAVIYLLANVGAFAYKASHYYYNRQDARAVFCYCILFARGAAMCLNLNCALILLPMSRHVLTRIRGFHRFRNILPFDSATAAHMTIGKAIAFWTVVHVGAHIGDFYLFSHADSKDIAYLMKGKLDIYTPEDVPESPGDRWMLVLQTPAAITGVIMLVCMVVAYYCVYYQSKYGYNTFWYTHHMLIVMLVALCVHGTGALLEPFQSVYWIGFPLMLYLVPRLWRESKLKRPLQVLELRVKEGGQVTVLRLAKPVWWTHDRRLRAGMYFNINIPMFSHFEWHPFSNTAAPSDPFLEFHIRNTGDWTGSLCDTAKEYVHFLSEDEYARGTDETWRSVKTKSLRASDDVPDDFSINSSAMETDTFASKAFAIGDNQGDVSKLSDDSRGPSGLELTDHNLQKFQEGTKSLLSTPGLDASTVANSVMTEATRPLPSLKVYVEGPLGASSQGFSDHRVLVLCGAGIGATPMISVVKELLLRRRKMERTYFFWSFRDKAALDWFASLLDEVFFTNTDQTEDGQDLFVMRLFLTKAESSFVHESSNFRDHRVGDFRMQQSACYTVENGRPDWYEELTRVQTDAKEMGHKKAGVFICGPAAMSRVISQTAVKISKRDPKFHFYCREETFCSS